MQLKKARTGGLRQLGWLNVLWDGHELMCQQGATTWSGSMSYSDVLHFCREKCARDKLILAALSLITQSLQLRFGGGGGWREGREEVLDSKTPKSNCRARGFLPARFIDGTVSHCLYLHRCKKCPHLLPALPFSFESFSKTQQWKPPITYGAAVVPSYYCHLDSTTTSLKHIRHHRDPGAWA